MNTDLKALEQVLIDRRGARADTSYVASLYAAGNAKILQKLGEEAIETILAVSLGDKDKIIHEAADLFFHTMVMLVHNSVSLAEIEQELDRRRSRSGLEEKAARADK